MKLPSLQHIYKKAAITLRRFPLTLFSAAAVTGIMMYVIQVSQGDQPVLLRTGMCGTLGIALFTAISLHAERSNGRGSQWWISHTIGLALLIGYYFTLPSELNNASYNSAYRYLLFIIGVHLLVAIAPYAREGTMLEFWQYNKHLFLRFLTALLFSTVLYVGLSVALLSIHELLGMYIDYKIYLQLSAFIGIIFNTWFFLAGIPISLEVFAKRTTYATALKIFTQNVLLPLVVVYLIILYLYMIKIIAQWSWPQGWVTILVLSFSIVGLFAILLLYPIRYKAENKWINRFYTGYFAALTPLVIMLLLAIYRRVADYGVTVERYFVIILALWLAGVVLYFLISKRQNIKVIPGSLCILAFLISFDPWGAFSVSRRSQVNRLEGYLKQNDILKNDKIHPTSSVVPKQDRNEIISIVGYLNKANDLDVIQPWFDQSLTKESITVDGKDSLKTISRYSRGKRTLKLMGISGYSYNNSTKAESIKNYYVNSNQKNVFSIQTFDWFIQGVRWSHGGELNRIFTVNGRQLMIKSPKDEAKIHIYYKDAKSNALTVDMDTIAHELQHRISENNHQLPAQKLTFPVSNKQLQANVYIEQLHWSVNNDSTKQDYGTFSLALK